MLDRHRNAFTKFLLSGALVVLVLALASPQSASAQAKVGYIDASKLLKRLPEAVDAETRLGQLIASWNHEADDIQNDLNRKSSEYERRKLIMTDAERNAAEVDIQNLKKKIEDYRQSKYAQPNGELFSQEETLMKPAYDKLQKAISDVASELGYDFVFDRSSKDVVMLYANVRHDLTLAVAKKLNLETDQLTQPLINNTQKPGTPNGQTPNGQTPNGFTPNGQLPNGQQPGTAQVPNTGAPPVTGQPDGQPPISHAPNGGTPPVTPAH